MSDIPAAAIEVAVCYLPDIPRNDTDLRRRRNTALAMLDAAAPYIEAAARKDERRRLRRELVEALRDERMDVWDYDQALLKAEAIVTILCGREAPDE